MRILIAGGAGFIGSHMADEILASGEHDVTVFDNLSSGQTWHLKQHHGSPRFNLVHGNLRDLDAISAAMKGIQRVYHFASNPDIAKAMIDPSVDFWEGTYLTQNLLDAMRIAGAKEIVYASGSGVYGDLGSLAVTEDHAPMLPISTYGASKLACETLIHSYTHMFKMTGRIFRFANVVGGRQTHGVAYDFIRRLKADPTRLRILGNGTQSKSYIHVDDIVAGMQYFVGNDSGSYSYYHFATDDYLSVTEIADLVVSEMGLKGVVYDYTGGDRGWSGDVPVVRFDLSKVHGRGWGAKRSTRQAMLAAIGSMLAEVESETRG